MHNLVTECLNITEASAAFLETIEQQIGIVADLNRADILLYCRKSDDEVVIVSHARPRSLAHVYIKNRSGRIVSINHRLEVKEAFLFGKKQKDQHTFISEGAPVVRQTFPIYFPVNCNSLDKAIAAEPRPKQKIIAVLVIATNLIEYERHRLRSEVYRKALLKLQAMLVCGQIIGAENLDPFGEQDGIIYTDGEGIIRYASGIAANLYRRIGYKETLVGRPLSDLDTGDDDFRREALLQKRCMQYEAEEYHRFWVHKAIPLISYPPLALVWLKKLGFPVAAKQDGVIILLYDDTDARRQDRELRIKNAMIQEVHHRVKNNLQTIAGLLRMQARRVESKEAKTVLDETLHRVLSVAVIHEFLSNDSSNIINIKDVCKRIISQLQSMFTPDKTVEMQVIGDSIRLPARQATACSLIINELLQNSLEHGFEHKKEGIIQVNLEDGGEEVIIKVQDNGEGVPDTFSMEQASSSLGLHIVKLLVEGDLQGSIDLKNGLKGSGLGVKIVFSKNLFRGEEGWNEHVSL